MNFIECWAKRLAGSRQYVLDLGVNKRSYCT